MLVSQLVHASSSDVRALPFLSRDLQRPVSRKTQAAVPSQSHAQEPEVKDQAPQLNALSAEKDTKVFLEFSALKPDALESEL